MERLLRAKKLTSTARLSMLTLSSLAKRKLGYSPFHHQPAERQRVTGQVNMEGRRRGREGL